MMNHRRAVNLSLLTVSATGLICGITLERFIKRIQAGPLEAEHLRQEMIAGRTEYERVFGSHLSCNDAASQVADIIGKTDQYGLH